MCTPVRAPTRIPPYAERPLGVCVCVSRARSYNVTAFVDKHYAGRDAILRHAGGDATAWFNGPQHDDAARRMLTQYCIGCVAPPVA